MCAPHFPGHARPSPVLRDLAQITGLTGSTRPTRCPTSDPAACRSLQYHQPQHKLVPTPLCRVEPLDQVPLERLDAGLGDGVAPTKRSWRRHCLANVFAHGAVVLRALRGRLSTKSKLRRRGSRLQKDRRGADPRLRSLPAAPHASRQSSRPGAWARSWSSTRVAGRGAGRGPGPATSQLPTPPVTVNERHREYPEVSLSAYRLSCRQTLNHHLAQLGAEGKAAARIFCRRLLKSGEKISITGDLWSDN